MSSTHRQITLSRRPISITHIYDPNGRGGFGSTVGSLACAIRLALEANEAWGDLERVLESCLNVYMPRRGGGWMSSDADRFETFRAASAVERGAMFQARLDMETISIIPKKGVTITFSQGWTDRVKTPAFHIAFTDPVEGAKVLEKLNKLEYLCVEMVEWEQALYLKPWVSDHWIFSKNGAERLGERLTRIYKPGYGFRSQGNFDYYRLAPLPGETLVVYPGQAINALGFNPPHDPKAPRHPDQGIFASIGPFSLAFRGNEAFRTGRYVRDRIAVFEDQTLPIAPPLVDEDDGSTECPYYDPDPGDQRPDDDNFEPDDGSFRWHGRKN